jgi:hypothetical protein
MAATMENLPSAPQVTLVLTLSAVLELAAAETVAAAVEARSVIHVTLYQEPASNPTWNEQKPEDPEPQDTTPFPQDGTLGSALPAEAFCPGNDGQIKVINGRRFKVNCFQFTNCPDVENIPPQIYKATWEKCGQDCANNPQCKIFDYIIDGGK